MTESDYTGQLVRALRQRLPKAVTLKLSDRYTAGVPDFTTTLHKCTNWFEAKKIDARNVDGGWVTLRPVRSVPALQWEMLRKLGRGHLVVYTDHGHALTHVNGFRETVPIMRLRLVPLLELANRIVVVAEQGEKYNASEEW